MLIRTKLTQDPDNDRYSRRIPGDFRLKRSLLNGAAYIEPDSAGRLLVPPHLKEHAGLQKDLVMHWADDKLEIWDSNKYKQLFDSISPETLSKMVHKVLGGGNG